MLNRGPFVKTDLQFLHHSNITQSLNYAENEVIAALLVNASECGMGSVSWTRAQHPLVGQTSALLNNREKVMNIFLIYLKKKKWRLPLDEPFFNHANVFKTLEIVEKKKIKNSIVQSVRQLWYACVVCLGLSRIRLLH